MTVLRRSGSTDLVKIRSTRELAVSIMLVAGAALSLATASVMSVITSR